MNAFTISPPSPQPYMRGGAKNPRTLTGANFILLLTGLVGLILLAGCGGGGGPSASTAPAGPVVSVSPSTLTFASQAVGTNSAPQLVNVTNSGTATVTFTSITVGSNFSETNTCSSSLAAGSSCTASVAFTPTATGALTGTLTFTDNASNSPQTVSLSGTGTAPAVMLSSTSLTFAGQPVGTTSAAQSVTVTNSGTAPLSFTGIAATGDFAVAASGTTCSTSAPVAAGGNCVINVTFTPTATGTRSGSLTLTDNAPGSPQMVSLTGTGTAPAVGLSPTSLSFGNQLVSQPSASQSVTVTNSGSATLTISSIQVTGPNASDFAQTNTCVSPLAVNGTCAISVTFTPSLLSSESAAVAITDNASGSPQMVSLTGTGINTQQGTGITVTPASGPGQPTVSVTFPSVTQGGVTTVAPTSVCVTSPPSDTSVGTIPDCVDVETTAIYSGTVQVTMSFNPANFTNLAALVVCHLENGSWQDRTVSINTTLGIATAAVPSLSPIGVFQLVPEVGLSASSLTFSSQNLGTTSAAQTVTVNNTGLFSLNITSVALSGTNSGDYAQTNTCAGTSVPFAGSCTINVTFAPTATGTRTATLTITDNSNGVAGSTQTVSLTGTGGPGLVSIAVTPANPSISVGGTEQFTATGTYSDSSTQNLTTTATWSSLATSVATISNTSGSQGLATPTGIGTATIEATSGTISGSTTLTVTAGFALTGSLTTGREYPTATLLNNGTVLIAGGDNSAALASAELYNPATGTSTATGNLNNARYLHTATLLNNGMVLIAGGYGAGGVGATAELYNPATGTFTPTGSLNTGRDYHTATLLNNGMVLIAGGYNSSGSIVASAELYNPTTGTFAPTGSLNAARAGHTATLLNNGMVLMAGGNSAAGAVGIAELYNPATGSFSHTTGNLTTARWSHTATLLNNGLVLMAGGYNGSVLASAELYDPVAETFSTTASLNAARSSHTATLLNNGLVLMAAGFNSSLNPSSSAELYEPETLTPANLESIAVTPATATISPGTNQQFIATGTFSDESTEQLAAVTWSSSDTTLAQISNDVTNPGMSLAIAAGTATVTATAGTVSGTATLTVRPTGFVTTGNLNTARDYPTATLLNNGMVLIAGGYGSSNVLASAELYNPATGAYTTTGNLNTARYLHTATLLSNGMVLIAGGYGSSSALASAELYNPATGTFTATGNLNTARYYHTATLLNNGLVLIAGGEGASSLLESAELYNPATGTFSNTAVLGIELENHTATLLDNGMVLIAGGQGTNGYLASAELYNPATGQLANTTGSLNTARYNHMATLLPNGMVLLAGGSNGNSLATAELYNPATETFAYTTGSLNTARELGTATLLNSGLVLMAGGYYEYGDTETILSSAELYNPATGTFTSTGSLNTARYLHAAALLNNGTVLLTGGYGALVTGGSGPLASAELY